MSNNILLDPMYFDTAINPLTMPRPLTTVRSVEWVGPNAVGDKAYLYDSLGNIICDFTCVRAKENMMKDFGERGLTFNGNFDLSLLDSGYLLVAKL